MKKVLVTGACGFMGKNLLESLYRLENISVIPFSHKNGIPALESGLKDADIVFHLSGVNRPERPEDYETGNAGFTRTVAEALSKMGKRIPLVVSSSIQADSDNPYGRSKKKAEEAAREYAEKSGAAVYIYRLPNVFGKWSRHDYNSVVATFCHNISHGLDICISDRSKRLKLVYIDDVVASFIHCLDSGVGASGVYYPVIDRVFDLSLGELADRIHEIEDCRKASIIPYLSDNFTKCLYSVYLSYVDEDKLAYLPDVKVDNRGSLFELIKSHGAGQIFVSKSHTGVIRGNHYHNTKVEKFCVLKGEAVIRLRGIWDEKVISYPVSGEKIEIVDIPPGYTHSIENTGKEELIALFWANEIFNPRNPDTYYNNVLETSSLSI